jgi:hypothetical protein
MGYWSNDLYNYVNGRDGLEELVVDTIIDSVALPESTDDWRTDLTAVARAPWEALRSHPNAIPLILTRRSVSASSSAPAERMIEGYRDRVWTSIRFLLTSERFWHS